MSYIKEYSTRECQCCDGVDLCVDCDYYMSTMHYHPKYKPSLRTWYNKVTKNTEEKIREYFKKKKKTKKVEISF